MTSTVHTRPAGITRSTGAPRQGGAALTIGLILLVLLTLLGVTALRTTGLEERMAGHTRDRLMAFQAAEAALREGEAYLTNAVVGPFNHMAPHASGLYMPRVPGTDFTVPAAESCAVGATKCRPWWDILAWTAADSAEYGDPASTADDIAGVAQQPRYIIEDVSGAVNCTQPGFCKNIELPSAAGGSIKFGPVADVGVYRVTARGVGAQTDGAGNPLSVVVLQGNYRR
jgi:type IV pilus assembly protein PilX